MSSKEVNTQDHPFKESETKLFHNNLCEQQNPKKNPSMTNLSDEILDPDPIRVYVEPEITKFHHQYDQNPNRNPNQNPCFVQLNESFRGQVRNPNGNCIVISDDEKGENVEVKKQDGRTHSLPHNKYGPYVCPNCSGAVFATSQLFAAHVSSVHYKYETLAERRKRLAVKYKKKNLQVVQTSEGLTILTPNGGEDSSSSSSKTQKGQRKKAKKGEIQKEGVKEKLNLVDVKIKEDYK
ncbi:hypothetical protein Pint_31291 [Pistacia integerrima]|uniref:Uncharacterized protein n=1 Tax=Pistacia integerrima TaxID=434235 RepID=A0ACC0XLQ2_9ROSI|nr:hypothetical protein Pint_31291 [Pistacia integerrima]